MVVPEVIRQLRSLASQQAVRREAVRSKMEEYQARLTKLEDFIQIHHEARTCLVESSKCSRQKTIESVENIVTPALRSVFLDPSLTFRVVLSEYRDLLTADFLVEWKASGILAQADPLKAKGGALTDVITTALRFVFLTCQEPRRLPFLVLDEPGKFLDPDRRARYGIWLAGLSKELEIQVLCVTHDQEIKAIADQTYVFSLDPSGITKLTHHTQLRDLSGYGFNAKAR